MTITKFHTYILEIKKRAIYIAVSFFCTFALSYCKWHQLSYIFLLSFYNEKELQKNFIFTDIAEAFSSTLWVCCIFCFLFVLPFIVYQLICFLAPSWEQHEKRARCFFVFLSLLCWYLYLFLINQLIIPHLCSFLLEFQVSTNCLKITVQPKIYAYLLWSTSIMVLASLLFFCVILFFTAIEKKWVNLSGWQKQRRFCFFISILIAAFLSPPEIWSETILALGIYVFLELLIWFHFIVFRIRKIRF